MTPTEKQKCIVEQAVYGLKLAYIDAIITAKGYDTADNVVGVLYWNDEGVKDIAFERDCIPILRHRYDLAKEITHKGYNDDQSFVPLVELKIIGKIGNRGLYYEDGSFYGERSTALARDGFTGTFVHWNIPHQQQLLDLLHLWHFDTRNLIEKGDAINVNTLDINPYSVKL